MAKAEIVLGELSGGKTYYDYPLIQTGIQVNGSRCSFGANDGGYFIKNGRCYFDLTINILWDSGGNSSYLIGLPTISSSTPCASSNGSKWNFTHSTAAGVNYDSLDSTDTNPKVGDTIRLIGVYNTSASDTV